MKKHYIVWERAFVNDRELQYPLLLTADTNDKMEIINRWSSYYVHDENDLENLEIHMDKVNREWARYNDMDVVYTLIEIRRVPWIFYLILKKYLPEL